MECNRASLVESWRPREFAMRLAFWRAGKDKAPVRRAVSKPAPATYRPALAPQSGDLDLRALGQALLRHKNWVIVPTLVAAALSIAAVNLVTPRYKSEARILIDGRENVFLRPNGERNDEQRAGLDAEAVTSQVQLLLSRDLAREIIKKNKLAERPEFDPVLQGLSPVKSLLALFGIGRDPYSLTPEERVLDAYYDRFAAYAVDKSRVVVIEFQSRDPDLAARVANSIAEGYLVLQQNARQEQAKSAGQWLSGEIDSLRKKVAEAESRVEDFRSKSSLFVGTNNTTLSNQQMGELNTQLNNARALKSDAESKARLIREMLHSGKPIEASEVLNSELTRRLSEQRVTLRAQLDALFGQPAGQFGIEHLGSLDRLTAVKHLADQPRFRFRVGLQRAGVVQLRVQFAHLLIGQRRVVGADKQARFRAKILDAGFRLRNLLAQAVDFAGQPLPGRFGLLLPRALLQHQITFGDRVGDLRRQLRIARLEFDDDDARFIDGVCGEAVEKGIQHALFRRQRERIATDPEQGQHRFQRRNALQHRIEFRPLGKPVLFDDVAREIARQQQLHLTGNGLGIERAALLVAFAVWPQENVLASVDQDAGFGFVSRGNQIDGGNRKHGGKHGRNDDPAPLAHQRLAERAQIEIAGLGCRGRLAGDRRARRDGGKGHRLFLARPLLARRPER